MMNIGNRSLTQTASLHARHPRERGDPVHGFLFRIKPNRSYPESLSVAIKKGPANWRGFFYSDSSPRRHIRYISLPANRRHAAVTSHRTPKCRALSYLVSGDFSEKSQ